MTLNQNEDTSCGSGSTLIKRQQWNSEAEISKQ